MGWNETCKKLRKEIFTTDVKRISFIPGFLRLKPIKDHNMARLYKPQITIKTDAFGFKHKRITWIGDDAHRVYRLMKHLYRYNRRLG